MCRAWLGSAELGLVTMGSAGMERVDLAPRTGCNGLGWVELGFARGVMGSAGLSSAGIARLGSAAYAPGLARLPWARLEWA